MKEKFDQLLAENKRLSDLGSAAALLNWDQETYMPRGGAESRAEQLATIGTLMHQIGTADSLQKLIDELESGIEENGFEPWQQSMIREAAREQRRAAKLPEEFVGEYARRQSLAQRSWKQAREEKNFSIFRDDLARLVELKRREADYLGYEENIYDALIDNFERGMTTAKLRPVFSALREGTLGLLEKVSNGRPVDDSVLFTDFDGDRQMAYSREVVQRLGFDFDNGRIDLSTHPFCTSFAIRDVRLTTRVFRNDLRSCLFGLIHEAGHGMYEQGIDARFERTLLADGTSMGIHESQSLFWENVVGRSREFWQWAFPGLQKQFPEQLGNIDAFEFFRMVNAIRPSFIRVEADELTYNLHIILRFEIEEALINGRMEVDDIPAAWNEKMTEYLGITPADDAEGCLQDVHWSFGGFGYFPSYTLGKLYAAMFYYRALEAMPDMPEQIARGEFAAILEWLRENIHRWGKVKTADQLVNHVCGTSLTHTDFLRYIEEKIDTIY